MTKTGRGSDMTVFLVRCVDTERPFTWLDLCEHANIEDQDSGFFNQRVHVSAANLAELEEALEADNKVLSYKEVM